MPSGRTIEVVRFHEVQDATRPGLHVCPACECELVQPVTWDEVEAGRLELVLRCPNCHWLGEGLYSQTQVEQFEEKLDDGVEAILRDLKRLTTANMAEEVDRFAEALRADLILPEDF